MDRDWSNLPAKAIRLISKNILYMEQYTHLRLVCQRWKRFCPPHPRHLIGQVPWLWLPLDSSSSTFSFYDFSKSKIYNFNIPKITKKEISVSSRGWVLLEKDLEFSLINPISGELKRNCLPSLTSPPIILDFARSGKIGDSLDFDNRLGVDFQHIFKMILTSSPFDEGCIVVAEFQCSTWELGFCRIGDKSWTVLKLKEESGCNGRGMSDFKYKDGLVYAMNNIGQVTIYDLRDLSRKILTLSVKILGGLGSLPSFDVLYLVLGEGEFDGLILAVKQSCGVKTDEIFEVYSCVKTRGQYKWKRVRNIGNAVLVLDRRKCEILSLGNIQLNGWEANQICHHKIKFSQDRSYHNIIVKMASIENGSVKELHTSLGAFSAHGFDWFTPALR